MGEKSIEQRLRDIVQNQTSTPPENIILKASFTDDLMCDSLDTVELIMATEAEFAKEMGGEITEAEAEKVVTFGDAVDLVTRKIAAASAA